MSGFLGYIIDKIVEFLFVRGFRGVGDSKWRDAVVVLVGVFEDGMFGVDGVVWWVDSWFICRIIFVYFE